MFTMAKVTIKDGEEDFGFVTMAMIIRMARKDGFKPKTDNFLAYDKQDSRALSTALEKALKRLQASIEDCDSSDCEIPSDLLLTKEFLAEPIERFLCFSKGEAFEIQLGEQQEYRGSKPSKVPN
jgi:hypothetical protein